MQNIYITLYNQSIIYFLPRLEYHLCAITCLFEQNRQISSSLFQCYDVRMC